MTSIAAGEYEEELVRDGPKYKGGHNFLFVTRFDVGGEEKTLTYINTLIFLTRNVSTKSFDVV